MAHNLSKFESILFVDKTGMWIVGPGEGDGAKGPFAIPEQAFPEQGAFEAALSGSASLAIVLPDDWAQEQWFPFQSPKKNYMQAYAERLLNKQHAQSPELAFFYDLRKCSRGSEPGFLIASIAEPAFIRIWEVVKRVAAQVTVISTPGFLLKEWLLKLGLSTPEHGISVLLEQPDRFSLWALIGDRLAFYRGLRAPDDADPDKTAQYIAYELRQSLFYFAQQEKLPIKHLYLLGELSSRNWASGLTRELDLEVHNLSLPESTHPAAFYLDPESPLLPLLATLSAGTRHSQPLNLLPSPFKRELAVRPWTRAGILAGILVFIGIGGLLASFTYFANREKSFRLPHWKTRAETARQKMEDLSQLSQWITLSYDRPAAGKLIFRIYRILQDQTPGVEISEMEISPGTSSKVRLKAVLKAAEASDLEAHLKALIHSLGDLDPGLAKKDLAHFPLESADTVGEQKRYLLNLELSIPWPSSGSS